MINFWVRTYILGGKTIKEGQILILRLSYFHFFPKIWSGI